MTEAHCDVAILGAGAAGLFCAAELARRGKRVTVLEHSNQPGRKILISGGGRCNFTNIHTRPEHFLSRNLHFAKSALARYTPADFLQLVSKHGIPYHEKTLGQLFCDHSARQILDLLLKECAGRGVAIRLGCTVTGVRRATGYILETTAGPLHAPALVVATGGLSIPKLGATSYGYDLAQRFHVRLVPCRPALVPLTFNEADLRRFGPLSGVSTSVLASAGKARFREKMLFTHRGLSGPAVLQASSYWHPGTPLTLDLAPDRPLESELLKRKSLRERSSLRSLLAGFLPHRLVDVWLDEALAGRPLNSLGDATLRSLAQSFHRWQVFPSGTEGYEKAEVTAGGVDTACLDSRTMECRQVPGLYFIGEVVDVTGHLGGFNFQWAWSSAYSCAAAI